jgi:glycerol dehydrogenase
MERQDSVLLEEVVRFCSSVNLPTTLADNGLDGVSDADLQKVAVRATQPGETIHNELFEVTPPMVGDAIRQADTLGRSLAAS